MDIVQHIKQHTEDLQQGLIHCSPEQFKKLKTAVIGFYYLLPGFEDVINRYININITRDQLSADIIIENLESYQTAIAKSNAETDEYAADYEEPEDIDIFILEAFDNLVADTDNTASLVSLFIGVINTLDYYENFSDAPEYWNNLLEQELVLQKEILQAIARNELPDSSIYEKRYDKVDFTVI